MHDRFPAKQVPARRGMNPATLLEETASTLTAALEAGGIHELQDVSKEECLRALVQLLPLPDGRDRGLLLRLLLGRPASASLVVSDGIAIPYGSNPIVLHFCQPTITLALLSKPVDFGAADSKAVDSLFFIIGPTAHRHTQLLSRLSLALQDSDLKHAVNRHAPGDEIMRELRRVDAEMEAQELQGRRHERDLMISERRRSRCL
ncbi:MAG: PTS sugar transporter subunit IIA [Planctomycetes bacterium]|nr:PTS sugar transporter subunit IIA [Planctomycetota bacterium]